MLESPDFIDSFIINQISTNLSFHSSLFLALFPRNTYRGFIKMLLKPNNKSQSITFSSFLIGEKWNFLLFFWFDWFTQEKNNKWSDFV